MRWFALVTGTKGARISICNRKLAEVTYPSVLEVNPPPPEVPDRNLDPPEVTIVVTQSRHQGNDPFSKHVSY